MPDLTVSAAVDTFMTSANAAALRTNIGATTAGAALITVPNPSAITFIRVNADNTVDALSATNFKTALALENVTNTSVTTQNAASATLTNKTIGTGCVVPWEQTVVISAKGTDAAAGTNVAPPLLLPYAVTLTAVYAICAVAPTGSTAIIDINEGTPGTPGSTVLSTKLTIDAGEYSSLTAAVPPVISDSSLASGALITFDLDQVGSSVAGQCYVVTLVGTRIL